MGKLKLVSFDPNLGISLNFRRADYSIGSRGLYISWYDSNFKLLHPKPEWFISEALKTMKRSVFGKLTLC